MIESAGFTCYDLRSFSVPYRSMGARFSFWMRQRRMLAVWLSGADSICPCSFSVLEALRFGSHSLHN